jgi:cytochrome c biogenesis protein CcmG, thiol:disulfide interchange protein DsbE
MSITVFAVFLAGCGKEEAPPAPDYSHLTSKKTPAPLKALYEQGDERIEGGTEAFDAQIAKLKGFPVVANVWASWCGPCRAELPHLQQAVAKMGNEVAFLGVNPKDSAEFSEKFLEEFPVPYPSFVDPDSKISDQLNVDHGLPATAFFDENGDWVFTKSGSYSNVEDLEADIKTYAINGGEG